MATNILIPVDVPAFLISITSADTVKSIHNPQFLDSEPICDFLWQTAMLKLSQTYNMHSIHLAVNRPIAEMLEELTVYSYDNYIQEHKEE